MAVKESTCLSSYTNFVFLRSFLLCISLFCYISQAYDVDNAQNDEEYSLPTVFTAILVRNKAHALPSFFGLFEKLNYPKEKIAIWIKSDHNIDNSTEIIKEWMTGVEDLYHSIEFIYDDKQMGFENEIASCHWTDGRFQHIINERERAIHAARRMWADYLLMLDADVMIENHNMLQILLEQKKTIIAPMMNPGVGESYSNFWGGMDEDGYYQRVPDYFKIVEREVTGVFIVPMVHTIYLMNLKHKQSEKLTYIASLGYDKAEDDIIIFAINAQEAGVPLYVINTEHFGQIPIPLEEHHSLSVEQEQFMYMRIETIDKANPEMGPGVDYFVDGRGFIQSPFISQSLIPKDRLGFDKIYMINLERRSERRKRMLHVFDVFGIEAEWIPAVDGKKLNDTYLYADLGIEVVPGFTDPYGGRPMTMGEIGCFLSHYFIWKDMLKKGYSEIIVFEDDLRFEPYFRSKLTRIMRVVGKKQPDWDLIYLGRKRLNRKDEYYLQGTDLLVWPSYSYWTLSYLLSRRGAEKLLAQKPLQKLLPVDEYLPVMFDKHPEDSWKEPFEPRDLVALSAEPLLIYPTHYLGEPHYISDTEWSDLITEKTNHNSAEEPQKSPRPENEPKDENIPKDAKGYQLNPSSRQSDEL
ncbi:hypothetical protein ACF0H5_022254 [Mactra antiquata]